VSAVGTLDRETFVAHFGGVFEHSPWIAAAAFDAGLPEGPLTAEGLHARMVAALRAGSDRQKRALIEAHPDLAGRLAAAGRLTPESAKEQASAGLDLLSDAERARFTELNEAYKTKFGIPFIMADEEGVRFATSLTGSRALAGTFDPASLDTADADGITRREALVAFGCEPATIPQAARDPARTLGYVEFHIEQGPVLEAEGLPLGLVTAINGATRGEILVDGAAGHSGTLPMAMRRDAAAAAAEIVLAVERIGRSRPDLVATVGRIEIPNGAVNVVPGRARLSLDVRSPSDGDRAAALADIRAAMASIAQARGVNARLETSYDMPAAPCDDRLTAALAKSFSRCGHRDFRLPSGAGHDAMSFRGRIPMAMVFVRCRGGVSHRPDEHASRADIAAALAVLEDFIGSMGAGS
jgi:hydantoinase/carbamoylase family amidase